jgi:GLPGLI family protein
MHINPRIIFWLLLFLPSLLFSQETAKVTYTYSSYGEYTTTMDLIINEGKSLFIYHKDDETIVNSQQYNFHHYYEHHETMYDFATKQVKEFRRLKDETELFANWTMDLDWKITNETKVMNGYNVQKAVVQSYDNMGRDPEWEYGEAIAWFTTELPYSSGPDRYFGLPGLIVHLEFTNRRNISFSLKEISFEPQDPIELLPRGIRVSKSEIVRPSTIKKKWLEKERNKLSY